MWVKEQDALNLLWILLCVVMIEESCFVSLFRQDLVWIVPGLQMKGRGIGAEESYFSSLQYYHHITVLESNCFDSSHKMPSLLKELFCDMS